MTRHALFLATLVIAAMWFTSAAQAGAPTFSPAPVPRPQMACGTRDSVIARLGDKYGETWRGGGLSGPKALFEIWASDEWPGTWTFIKTTPDGLTCLVAVGDGWHDQIGKLAPIGDPA